MHSIVIVVAKYFIIVPFIAVIIPVFIQKKSARYRYIAFGLLSTAITLLLVKLATTTHSDPRPFIRDGVKPYFASSTDNGFPSDHTAMAALCAFIVFRYYRKTGIALLALAVLIGSARVIAGVHHAQDIVGGAVLAGIGVGLGYLVLKISLDRKTSP